MILEPFERISSEYLAVFLNHSVSLIVSFSVPLTLSVFCFFAFFAASVSASLSHSLPLFLFL